MREIVLDTETTGLSYKNGDRIIEVGCVELINHVPSNNNLQFYCSTDVVVNEGAAKVHGLTNSFLRDYPSFENQSKKLLDFIANDTLIIHNSEFDTGFINNELKLINIGPLKNKVIDTVSLARKKLNTRIANLDYLCRRFSIDLSKRSLHGALLDCQLLSEVYLELIGGKQAHLELSESKKIKIEIKKKYTKEEKKIILIENNKEEILAHKKLTKNIKNASWSKINY